MSLQKSSALHQTCSGCFRYLRNIWSPCEPGLQPRRPHLWWCSTKSVLFGFLDTEQTRNRRSATEIADLASKVEVSSHYKYRYSYRSYRLVCKQWNERTEQAHRQLKVRVHALEQGNERREARPYGTNPSSMTVNSRIYRNPTTQVALEHRKVECDILDARS